MAFDKVADFEEGDTTDFDSETDADGDLNAAVAAAHDGSYGIEMTYDDANLMYGQLNMGAVNQTTAVVSFWLNLNNVSDTGSPGLWIMDGIDGGGARSFLLVLNLNAPTAGKWGLYTYYYDDAPTPILIDGTGTVLELATWYHILIQWKAATSPGANNGIMRLYLDGVLEREVTNGDNDTQDVDSIRFGSVNTNPTAPSGSYYMDTLYIDPVEIDFPVLAGSITPTGSLARTPLKIIAGAITNVGTLTRLTSKILAGSIANTGALTKTAIKAFAGSIANTGTLVRTTLKTLAGSITNTGALTTVKAVLQKFYTWTAHFRASDDEDITYNAGSEDPRRRA